MNQLKEKEDQNFEYIRNLENNLRKSKVFFLFFIVFYINCSFLAQNELTTVRKCQEIKQIRKPGNLKLKNQNDPNSLFYDFGINLGSLSEVKKWEENERGRSQRERRKVGGGE